ITKSDISAKKHDMEYSTMFSSKKNRTSMYNGKSTSPPLSSLTPSSSHSSSSSISHPILHKESKKTQILGEFSSNSRSAQFIPNKTERIIGINGRQMIKINGR
ncbi:hypothetical protein PENTCL1PPCAC_12587, partial [Pristionchus entomophagus]